MTKEERAANYVDKQCKGCQKQEKVGRYQGYIQGAFEQEAVDIEKACEWLKANIKIVFHDGVKPFMVESAFTDKFVDVFKKAMKGE